MHNVGIQQESNSSRTDLILRQYLLSGYFQVFASRSVLQQSSLGASLPGADGAAVVLGGGADILDGRQEEEDAGVGGVLGQGRLRLREVRLQGQPQLMF